LARPQRIMGTEGEAVAALTASHTGMPVPPEAGQGIALKRR
jgi:hypothetical protein